MFTPERLTGCALATLTLSLVAPAASLAQSEEPASPPSVSKGAVGSYSGASPKPESQPAPQADPAPVATEAPPPATPAPTDSPASSSPTGAVRTFSASTASDSGATSRPLTPVYATAGRMRISMPHYTVQQISRSILRLRIDAITRASMPLLPAAAVTPTEGSEPAPDLQTAEPLATPPSPLAVTPVE